mgnify:CR=1 FL=1
MFGFETLEEKKLFTELLKISGIGGKVGLQILMLGNNALIEAVQHEDTKTIESIKGIGKKMAEKIILELKDKDFVKGFQASKTKKSSLIHTSLPQSLLENIKITLQNMGYHPQDIDKVLQLLPKEYQNLEQILPFMIRELS